MLGAMQNCQLSENAGVGHFSIVLLIFPVFLINFFSNWVQRFVTWCRFHGQLWTIGYDISCNSHSEWTPWDMRLLGPLDSDKVVSWFSWVVVNFNSVNISLINWIDVDLEGIPHSMKSNLKCTGASIPRFDHKRACSSNKAIF